MSSSPPLVVADRYRLVAPLGQGGMGRVWRATDVVLHRDVAIKELVPPPGLTAGERQEMRERSLREARAIARLNNVNVVRVFDVLRTDADPWIVMEYVPSRSLQDTLASDGPFSPVRAAEMGLGVLGALRAAHRAGVVHRDVKPGNVLIGADGRVVLTDFGLATVPGDPNVTRTGLVLGSPAYIAPERARDGTAGPAADLWSLGATLYAAVEGASPFARPSAIATLAALATENPPPARNAGPLKPVLNGLLRKDPTHRINADEAERLLLRAAGRRSRLTFPMSPTMRRPGVGRERPALPGPGASSVAPMVPGPRPPVAPLRPAEPPGHSPVSGGRVEGRPPVFAPGKASVGRPAAETPTRVDGPKVDAPRLDATRLDAPPVRDGGDKPAKPFGTRQAPPPTAPPGSGAPEQAQGGTSRTVRGERGGLTAADVAANRRKKAAPEHEKSLAEAAPPAIADATTVVPPGANKPRRKPAGAPAQAAADATTAVDAPAPVEAPAPEDTATPDSAAGVEQAEVEQAEVEQAEVEQAEVEKKEPDAAATPETSEPVEAAAEASVATGEPAAAEDEAAETEAASPAVKSGDEGAGAGSEAPAVDAAAAAVKAPASAGKKARTRPARTQPTAAELTAPEPAQVVVPLARTAPASETPEASAEAAGTAETDARAAQVEEASAPAEGGEAPAPGEPVSAAPTSGAPASEAPAKETPAGETSAEHAGDPGPMPGVDRPSRPAWKPMQVRPPVRRGGGITVFGTRLTYRQAATGGGALLVVLVLLIVLAVKAFGGGDGGPAATKATTPAGPAAAATTTPATAPSSPPATQTSVQPSSAPPTSAAPSSPASGGGNVTLPAGWKWYNLATQGDTPGFTVPIPQNAAIQPTGSQIYFRWNNRLLIVDRTNQPKADPVQDWKDQAAQRNYRDYHVIKIVPVNYFEAGADWEFTYTTNNGNPQHANKRNVVVSDKAAYSLNWYTSPDDWTASQTDLQLIYQGFQPKP